MLQLLVGISLSPNQGVHRLVTVYYMFILLF